MDDESLLNQKGLEMILEAAKCMFHILCGNARWDLLPVMTPKK